MKAYFFSLLRSNRAIWQTIVVAGLLIVFIEAYMAELLIRHFVFSAVLLLFSHTFGQLNGGYPKSATDYTYYSLGMLGVVLFFLADEPSRRLNILDAQIVALSKDRAAAQVRLDGLQDRLSDGQIGNFFNNFKRSIVEYSISWEAAYEEEIDACEEGAGLFSNVPNQEESLLKCLEDLSVPTLRQLRSVVTPDELRQLVRANGVARFHLGKILEQEPSNPSFIASSIILGLDVGCGNRLECIQDATESLNSIVERRQTVITDRNSYEIDNLSDFQVTIRDVRLSIWPFVLLTAFCLKISAVSTGELTKSRQTREQKKLQEDHETVTSPVYHKTSAGIAAYMRKMLLEDKLPDDSFESACSSINSLLREADKTGSSISREVLTTTALAIYEHHPVFSALLHGPIDTDPERLRVRAQCYERAGLVLRSSGRVKDAERCLLRSLNSWEKLETTGSTPTLTNQMFVIENLVELYATSNDEAGAKSSARKAKKLVKRFDGEDQKNAREFVSHLSEKSKLT